MFFKQMSRIGWMDTKMFNKKEYTDVFVHRNKIHIAFILLIVLAICFLLKLTPAIEIYWINFITSMVVDSGISILVISGLLIAIHFVEIRMYEERLKEDGKDNGNG